MSTTSTNHYSSIIIGAGQAGLATSYWLSKQNI
ncbi:MAG: cation diffusion facilitator CzcD-associated flavoprotein CzcO, partial [Bacteroidia bacterium]